MNVLCLTMTGFLIVCIGCVLRCNLEMERWLDNMISMRQQVEYMDDWMLMEKRVTEHAVDVLNI